MEEQAVSAIQQMQMQDDKEQQEARMMPDTQVHDLVAMLECQAYALEDIMKQKKQLAAHVKQTSSSVKKQHQQQQRRDRSISAHSGGQNINVNHLDERVDRMNINRPSKIGAGVKNVATT